MQQFILLNLLGMCISFLMICHMERKENGSIEEITDSIWILLAATIFYPVGIFVFVCMNFKTTTTSLFKERKFLGGK